MLSPSVIIEECFECLILDGRLYGLPYTTFEEKIAKRLKAKKFPVDEHILAYTWKHLTKQKEVIFFSVCDKDAGGNAVEVRDFSDSFSIALPIFMW